MADEFMQSIKNDNFILFRWATGNEIFKFLNRENEDTLWDYVDRFIDRGTNNVKINVFSEIFWDWYKI